LKIFYAGERLARERCDCFAYSAVFGGYHFDYTTALYAHLNANIGSPPFSGGSN
jgi:hypothetical protein